jgi:serine/threonine-protein kinase
MSTQIGHYDIVAELGRGGMGVVYKGHEAALGRYVAIKMLAPALAHDESVKERFLREARSMASLNDPHIIQIYYIGEWEGGQPYFAMEFVEGESLSTWLKRETRMTPEQAARVVYQTASGLATAHDRGVIHRDIKPANLMLDQRGRIKIADFGIALSSTDFSKKLTSTGEFVGTPGYLSPEVCTGQQVDQRSDIFSLGIVLFELLTGRMPFNDQSPLGLLLEVVRAEIPDVRELNSAVDAELTHILQRMTAKDPAQRYQNCHELIADLMRHPLVAGAQTISAKPVMTMAAGTQFGMKTPPQLRAPSALHTIASPTPAPRSTPSPVAAAAADAGIGATEVRSAPPVRQSVLVDSPRGQPARNGAVWALAAVLLLGLLGFGAWAMRGQFMPGKADAGQVASLNSAAATPAVAAPPAVASAPAAVATDPTGLPPEAAAAIKQATEAAAQIAQIAQQMEQQAQSAPAAPGATGIAGAATQDNEPAVESDPSLGPLRRMAAERKAELARQNVPAPPAAPRRDVGPPRVAVVAFGDQALTGAAKQLVEDALIDAGYLLVDDAMVPGLADLGGNGADLPAVFSVLARNAGVRAVAVIRAEPIGSTQLNYYGQSDTLYSANLTVRAYDVHNRTPLGSGVRQKVDFTALNADFKAKEAIQPNLPRLVGSMAAFKPRSQGG